MKNLIDEIEKWYDKAEEDYMTCPPDREVRAYIEGKSDAFKYCLNLLNQHNIITAPKSIKLSELIDKICDTNYKSECWVEPIRLGKGNYRIRTQYGDGYWGDYDFYIEDKKIVMYQDDCLLPFSKFKWLYTLWIAGTEVIDDLECDE